MSNISTLASEFPAATGADNLPPFFAEEHEEFEDVTLSEDEYSSEDESLYSSDSEQVLATGKANEDTNQHPAIIAVLLGFVFLFFLAIGISIWHVRWQDQHDKNIHPEIDSDDGSEAPVSASLTEAVTEEIPGSTQTDLHGADGRAQSGIDGAQPSDDGAQQGDDGAQQGYKVLPLLE